ncbi:MAG TPA: class I SAM-dependent methyltransferase [Syntrophales bacterium]|nr:class I SAM-dependent methyltransferase [Syntrophales bacterium]
MNLKTIIDRTIPPLSWAEGENIPWNDPDFSRRMLAEHLSQEHNLASRRFDIIDRQVGWIHSVLLGGRETRILELACGPGLYTSRLARLGHACVGIDYAPEPIRYARDTAVREGLDCRYRLEDVRTADYGGGYGLVMMIFGQLNVFRRSDARRILEKALSALAPDGLLLLEPQRFDTVMKQGQAGSSWYACGEGGGLFSDRPHLCLTESFWNADGLAATQRFFIVDAETGAVTRHAMTSEAYTEEQFRDVLVRTGFEDVRFYPSLTGVEVEEESQSANLAIAARKGRG